MPLTPAVPTTISAFQLSSFPSIDPPFSVRVSSSARLQVNYLTNQETTISLRFVNSESSDSHYSLTVLLPFTLAVPGSHSRRAWRPSAATPPHTTTLHDLGWGIEKTNKNRNEATRRHHVPRKVLFCFCPRHTKEDPCLPFLLL